jgi:hypothetical protein
MPLTKTGTVNGWTQDYDMRDITRQGWTHMMSKGFAIGAALLAALVSGVARAELVLLLPQSHGTIKATGPNSFIGTGGISGDAIWVTGNFEAGGYNLEDFSAPGTSPSFGFSTNPGLSTFSGPVDWTAVEGSPASPELVGTLTIDSVFASSSEQHAAAFLADFVVGASYSIELRLLPDSEYCLSQGFPVGSGCASIVLGSEIGFGSAPMPEPPGLAVPRSGSRPLSTRTQVSRPLNRGIPQGDRAGT